MHLIGELVATERHRRVVTVGPVAFQLTGVVKPHHRRDWRIARLKFFDNRIGIRLGFVKIPCFYDIIILKILTIFRVAPMPRSRIQNQKGSRIMRSNNAIPTKRPIEKRGSAGVGLWASSVRVRCD